MTSSPEERRAVACAAELEAPLLAVEHSLSALGGALHRQDAEAVDYAAAQLHAALSAAVLQFARAARSGGVPSGLRQRLALASGQVAAQREALARATASLDRAIDLLIPRSTLPGLPGSGFYGAGGNAERGASSGSLLA